MTDFWTDTASRRVVRLVGADAEAIVTSLESLPSGAPAVVTYYPHLEPTTSKVVDSILRELEATAIELFPSWLPAASEISGPGGVGVPAVRAVAKDVAATSHHFGPFLAELAEHGLRRANGMSRFPRETRAAGLMRVLKASYNRSSAAILVPVPENFPIACQRALVSACEWVAQQGDVGVWLAGQLEAAERINSVVARQPNHLVSLVDGDVPEAMRTPASPTVVYPPVVGKPHPGSPAERKLEDALAKRAWAAGRVWNQTYCSHPLVNPVRLDLWWRDERFVVEIDGPDHRSKWKFAEDHRRDVMLHGDGLAVLRFTNAQVLDDLDVVLAAIEQFIHTRRNTQGVLSSYA